MRIERPDNLTIALIHRDRAALATGCRPQSLDRQIDTRHASAARILLVPPTDCAPADGESRDRITPATWPYCPPLQSPKADQPYQPHRIPETRNQLAPEPKMIPPMTDHTKGTILDLFA